MIEEVKLDNPFKYKLIYKESEEVGFLEYSLIYDRMEIDDFFVKEEHRNKKIGTKLLSHLVSIAIIERVVNITLEVRESNEIARLLYRNFGFREVALRKNYYGNENGILMEKQVM